ncbi:hypothetical protein SCLCIDRAFT_1225360, partial [Scleroderma citrinum Foug A]
ESLDICRRWRETLHLDFQDTYQVPIFERPLKQVSTKHGQACAQHFRAILQEMQLTKSSTAVIVVRGSDSIVCLKLFEPGNDVFVLFDTRPPPDHPDGVAMTFSRSIEQTVHRLCILMPSVTPGGQNSNLHWQSRLLSNCISYVFVPRSADGGDSEGPLLHSSLVLLTLQAERSELKRNHTHLLSRNQTLERRMTELQRTLQEEKEKASQRRIEQQSRVAPRPSNRDVFRPSTRIHHPQSSTKRTDLGVTFPPEDSDPNLILALELQRSFDLEDRELTAQRGALLKTAQRQYHCSVCLDDFPEDDVVRIDGCGHEICRDCVRGHVCSKIDEHRFPVLCPVCTADRGNRNPSTITGQLVQLLGVSEEQYQTWVEMEMAQCNQSAFVDRHDMEAADLMQCPVLGCDHVWCRKCQQTVERGGPDHSCDGSKELEHLVQEQGWRFCPNCKTPIQKLSGCNHLSCIAPGCNTHFCYACGATINRTAIPSEIAAGKSAHFANCRIW